MGKPHEVAAAKWLTDRIPSLNRTTIINGSDADDKDCRDVWLDIPGIGLRSMGIRVFEPGHMSREAEFRVKNRYRNGSESNSEFLKFCDPNRQCCHLYLQRWDAYQGKEAEFVLLNIVKARRLGLFEQSALGGSFWSKSLLNGKKDAYFTDVSIGKLIDHGVVLKCHVFNRAAFNCPKLDAHFYAGESRILYEI